MNTCPHVSINTIPDYATSNDLSCPPAISSINPPPSPVLDPSILHVPKKSKTPCNDAGIRKRNLNTQAARRYRQKKTDETSNLASELQEIRVERDGLKDRVARLEGEIRGLQQLLKAQK